MNLNYSDNILEKCLPKYLEEDLKKLKDYTVKNTTLVLII